MSNALAPACAAILGVLVCSAGISAEPGRENPPAVSPPYHVVMDIHQTMAWMVDPAADVIWDSAGTIITEAGSEELAPTTDAGWDKVLRAAATLSEAGNLLMMPGRAVGADWITYAQELVATGQLAMQAAQARDDEALFVAGGKIYQVCRGCHDQYWVEIDASQ